ncbi:unnamed protein product [Linum trigynum]|uniref:Uncharacterized protein n=1 Tax=Linum trigynum TaxID=586398 RepID=A0AAV2D8N8_9ROSI
MASKKASSKRPVEKKKTTRIRISTSSVDTGGLFSSEGGSEDYEGEEETEFGARDLEEGQMRRAQEEEEEGGSGGGDWVVGTAVTVLAVGNDVQGGRESEGELRGGEEVGGSERGFQGPGKYLFQRS